MIPKIIHYCWFGGGPLPSKVKECISSWERFCPDYEIIQWNESNFLIEKQNDFVKAAYKEREWAFVSDYARLKIIYENGGIYLDTDVELIKNLDNLLTEEAFFGVHQGNYLIATGLGFGAKKGNPILFELLTLYDNVEFNSNKKEELVCPQFNSPLFFNKGYRASDSVVNFENFTIYPPEYFDPISVGTNTENLLSDNTFSIHHYSASWTPFTTRVKSKLFGIIGRNRIIKIKKMFFK